jgi:DNA-binding beta-propeller fold protein YncE
MRCGIKLLVSSLMATFFILTVRAPQVRAETSVEFKTYVMDAENKTVKSIAFPSGNIAEFPKFENTPNLLVLSPDGSRLLVFEYSKQERLSELRAKGQPIIRFGKPNSLNIFNTADMKLVAKIEEAGWNAVAHPAYVWPQAEISAAWDPSGKILTILAWGVKDKSPEIVQVDIARGAIAARKTLACKPGEVNPMLQISGDTAAILYGKRIRDKKTPAAHKLLLVNLGNLESSKEISLPGIPRDLTRSPEGDVLFVMTDDGNKLKEPGQAHLHIISVAQGSLLQSIDGGFELIDAQIDNAGGLTFITRIGKDGKSTLFAFQKDKKKAEIEIPDVIRQSEIAPKTKRLFLLCYNSVHVIDLETLKEAGSISAPHRERGVWESGNRDRPPSSLAFDSTENTGILGYSGDDELSVLDLKEFKVKGTIDLVSGLKAFAGRMLVAGVTGAIGGIGSAATGAPVFVWVPAGPSAKYITSLVDPTDQYAFIMLLARVFVVDLKTYKKVASITLNFNSSYGYVPPQPEGKVPLLFVVGSHMGFTSKFTYRMDVVNMATKEKLPDQKWLGHCLYSPDGKYAVNYDEENFYLLDGANLSNVKTIGGFKELRQILMAR